MNLLELNEEQLKGMNNDQLKQRVNEWDLEQWRDGMSEKSTLERYRSGKKDIYEEKWFCNA